MEYQPLSKHHFLDIFALLLLLCLLGHVVNLSLFCNFVLGIPPLPIHALEKIFFAVGGEKNKIKSIPIMESTYATRQEILEQFTKSDFNKIILKLEVYARGRIQNMGLSVEAIDLVYDVLLGIQESEGGRNWNKSICPQFDRFLFGCLKSHISNEWKKLKKKNVAEPGHVESYQSASIEVTVVEEIDFDTARRSALELIQELGGNVEEEFVFECWCDGMDKPQEIAELLGVSVEVVYKATKRLERKLLLIRERLNNYHP